MKNSAKIEKPVKIYSIVIKKSAQRFLENIENKYFDKIDAKIRSLKSDPYPRNSKKILMFDCYRVRVGDIRILYTVDSKESIITILDIDKRKDIYKKG